MPAAELVELKADIAENGLMLSITTLDNMILDGWHRYQCCLKLDIEPRMKPLAEELDPVAFVRSMNGTRRHMTASQRAVTEVSINEWAKRGGQAELPPDSHSKPATAEAMAEAAHVSVATIKQAKAVVQHATPAVVAAVKAGEISVKKAVESLPARPADPVSKFPEYDAAIARIAKLIGKDEAVAVQEGGAAVISAKEAIVWAKLPDDKMREVGRLVIGQHWTPSRALRLIDNMVDEKTRIEDIIGLCIAANGTWEATICGHIVTVEKRGGYKQ